MNDVYLGFDPREEAAYAVAKHSLVATAAAPVNVHKLDLAKLQAHGLMFRPTDTRGSRFDLISGAPMATEFAITRFLPFLFQCGGWALFADSDTVFLQDVAELFALADPDYAVMCVKHQHVDGPSSKMDGQVQTYYARKNWSSVMLINSEHPANRRLTLQDVNTRPGRDLHGFYWLADREIGALLPEWNWLVNVEEMPPRPGIAHFTLGGPWLPTWEPHANDEYWLEAEKRRCADEV